MSGGRQSGWRSRGEVCRCGSGLATPVCRLDASRSSGLQAEHPERYPDRLLRTLQRRLKVWRGEMAETLVFGIAGPPEPGPMPSMEGHVRAVLPAAEHGTEGNRQDFEQVVPRVVPAWIIKLRKTGCKLLHGIPQCRNSMVRTNSGSRRKPLLHVQKINVIPLGELRCVRLEGSFGVVVQEMPERTNKAARGCSVPPSDGCADIVHEHIPLWGQSPYGASQLRGQQREFPARAHAH